MRNVGRWTVNLSRRWVKVWFPYIALSSGIYLVMVVFGAAAGTHATPLPGIRAGADGFTTPSAWFFFIYNGLTLLATAFGFLFGAVPTLALLGYNGFLLGSTVIKAIGTVGPATAIALVVPHAIFELPAFWLAGAIGFRSIHLVWCISEGSRNRTSVPVYLRQAVVALLFSGILVGIAAVVESQFTIPIARTFTEYR